MENNELIDLLTILLGIMISILIVLCIIFVVLEFKTKKSEKKKKNQKLENKQDTKDSVSHTYNKESIFKFMEFDKIEDNMIVQKDGKRFLMIIECQGINFDLMSGLEKNSVEQGFLQFLNTLRYPIQIYVQTRTVNLGSSIHTYKDRVAEISRNLSNKQMEYNQKLRSCQYTEKQLQKDKYELVRLKNLYEYSIDVISNTERMSLNKNILSKHYYVIIPYFSEEASDREFDKYEISNLAFSELYTKAQSIISSLSVCGINSKILNSVELAELLYVAYNRDESEVMNLQRTLSAGFEDLYSTAPNVLDKRMKELDLKIQEDGIKRANDAVIEAMQESKKQKEVRKKEEQIDQLIDEFAKILIEDNKQDIGEEVAEHAVEKLKKGRKKKTEEKGGDNSVKETKKTTTRRTRNTV